MMAAGCSKRKTSRQRPVKSAQRNAVPPQRTSAAGPFASAASPRKQPKRIALTKVEEPAREGGLPDEAPTEMGAGASWTRTAAQTMATVSIAENGMSITAS